MGANPAAGKAIPAKKQAEKGLPPQPNIGGTYPDTLQSTLDSAFNKAFSLIFEKGTGVIRKDLQQRQKENSGKAAGGNANENGDRSTLRAFKSTSSLSAAKNLTISSVEGIGLGVLGIGLPDISPVLCHDFQKSL